MSVYKKFAKIIAVFLIVLGAYLFISSLIVRYPEFVEAKDELIDLVDNDYTLDISAAWYAIDPYSSDTTNIIIIFTADNTYSDFTRPTLFVYDIDSGYDRTYQDGDTVFGRDLYAFYSDTDLKIKDVPQLVISGESTKPVIGIVLFMVGTVLFVLSSNIFGNRKKMSEEPYNSKNIQLSNSNAGGSKQRLKELKDLFDDDLISQDEYDKLREDILKEI